MNTLLIMLGVLAALAALAASITLPALRHRSDRQSTPPEPAPDTLDLQIQLYNGAEIAAIPEEAHAPQQRAPYRQRVLILSLVALAVIVALGLMLNERRTARAPERLVIIVAPFADNGTGQTGRNVANELTRLLAEQTRGATTVALALRSPTDAADALALAQLERADLLIWGEVEPGAMLDSPGLRPRLVYRPIGPYGPNAWAGYQGRFAMPQNFTLAREPINGQAVLAPLVLALADYVNGEPDRAYNQLIRLSDDYPSLNLTLPGILRGNILWARGFYAEAAAAYRQALAEPMLDPDAALLANNLAAILLDAGDPNPLAALAEAVRLLNGRDLGELRANLGTLALAEGRPTAAAIEFEQARNLLPPTTALLLDLTVAYRETGRLEEAQATMSAAEAQAPYDKLLVPPRYRALTTQRLEANLREQAALLQLAIALRAQGPLVWELEVAPLQPAATLRPIHDQLSDAADASDQTVRQWRSLAASESAATPGTGLLAGGQAERIELQAARQRYYVALVGVELDRLNLGRSQSIFSALFGRRETASASLRLLQDLVLRQPANPQLHAAIGRAALVANQNELAEEHYNQVTTLTPQAPEGFFGQGRVATATDATRAAELYTTALERNSSFFPAHVELARMAELRGDWATVIAHRRALQELRSGSASTVALAYALRRSGPENWPEAEQLLIPLRGESAEAAIELARLYNDARQPDLALGAYRNALNLDPNSSVAAFELGESLERQGDYAEAERALRQALKLDAQHLEARLALAELYQGPLGDPVSAEREFQAALRQGVADPAWLERIGDAAMENGNAEQAQKTYARAIEQRADNAVLYHKLGLAQEAQGQHEAAARSQRRALELVGTADDPTARALRAAALVSLGDALRLQGRDDEVFSIYNEALQLDAARIEAQIGLGLLAVGANNWGVAHGYFTTAAALPGGDQSAEAQFWLAESLLRRDDLAGASARYERALELRPDFPEAYLGLAQTRYAQRDPEAALVMINCGLAQQPAFAEGLLFKAKLLQAQNQVAQALDAYDRSISANGQIAESHYRRGMLHIQEANYDAAIRDLRQAIKLQANFSEAAYWLGRAYYAQGRTELALRAFRQAISYNGNYTEAILYSGLVAEDLGRTTEAISAYQTVIQIDAQSEFATRARLQLERLT